MQVVLGLSLGYVHSEWNLPSVLKMRCERRSFSWTHQCQFTINGGKKNTYKGTTQRQVGGRMIVHSLCPCKGQSFCHVQLIATLWTVQVLRPWDSPGKNTGVGSHPLLQGIFPTQGLNSGLPHCRQTLYHLCHQGSPSSFLGSCNHLSLKSVFQHCSCQRNCKQAVKIKYQNKQLKQ